MGAGSALRYLDAFGCTKVSENWTKTVIFPEIKAWNERTVEMWERGGCPTSDCHILPSFWNARLYQKLKWGNCFHFFIYSEGYSIYLKNQMYVFNNRTLILRLWGCMFQETLHLSCLMGSSWNGKFIGKWLKNDFH